LERGLEILVRTRKLSAGRVKATFDWLGPASRTARFAATKRLDIAIVLAVIQAARPEGPHGVLDPKVLSTLARLDTLFAKAYKINRERGVLRARDGTLF
jgi:hypothetical protein